MLGGGGAIFGLNMNRFRFASRHNYRALNSILNFCSIKTLWWCRNGVKSAISGEYVIFLYTCSLNRRIETDQFRLLSTQPYTVLC